ncbi:MAG: polyphosphate polymerase domain-containing protein [Clostridia bacterium]|nr:polyphosphate polymerase domain-containing protein [Clostridia bacterium]
MHFRHEWKHEISVSDKIALRQRLSAVMQHDLHAVDGRYTIRSLYFDDLFDTALREKLDGISRREKFRIRYYGGDTSHITLEKKSKIAGLCTKESAPLTAAEAQKIVDGSLDWMRASPHALIRELYRKMQTGLRPKTIVDYTREPFVYPPGNVRVTLDYHIRTGLGCVDFLNPDAVTVPVPEDPIILEVKWDEFLPDCIRDIVQLSGRRTSAFSKYAVCRAYD